MLKHKVIALILTAHVGRPHAPAPTRLLYGPDSRGRYAVAGEGFVSTRSCTVTADGMRARIDGRFVTFLDREGNEEGQCELGERPVVSTERPVIHRQVGVTE